VRTILVLYDYDYIMANLGSMGRNTGTWYCGELPGLYGLLPWMACVKSGIASTECCPIYDAGRDPISPPPKLHCSVCIVFVVVHTVCQTDDSSMGCPSGLVGNLSNHRMTLGICGCAQ